MQSDIHRNSPTAEALVHSALPFIITLFLFVPALASSAENLHNCADLSGHDCPEKLLIYPSVQSIELAGTNYPDVVPWTLDLAEWGREYYHGALALMLPGNLYTGVWVPPDAYAAPSHVAYRDWTDRTDGAKPCHGIPTPCIDNEGPPQWGVYLQSIRRAREMVGNDVSAADAQRELSSLRGLYQYDQWAYANFTSESVQNGPTFFYDMMLFGDLRRQLPNNTRLVEVANDYLRFMNALLMTEGGFQYWYNQPWPTGSYEGGYYNVNGLRVGFQGYMGEPLLSWYLQTGNQLALDLGKKAANYLRNYGNGIFWANPDPARFTADPPIAFVGHTLNYSVAYLTILTDARARLKANPQDPVARQEVQFVKDAYEFMKRRGDAGIIGNFGVSSYLGVVMQIGIQLAQMAYVYPDIVPFGTYYEDVERWVRNQATEMRIDADTAKYISDAPNASEQRDRIASRALGTFISDNTHPFSIPFTTFMDGNDSLWLFRGLYDVWKYTVEIRTSNNVTYATVNFLLNNASKYLDVYSDIPYRGRVAVRMHNDIGPVQALSVRMPVWAGQDIAVYENVGNGDVQIAQGSRWTWNNRYIVVNSVKPGARYTFMFTLPVRHQQIRQLRLQNQWWHEGTYGGLPGLGDVETNTVYNGTFIGDFLVHVDPWPTEGVRRYTWRDGFYSLIQNDRYAGVAPPQRGVNRFVFGGATEPPPPLPAPKPPTVSLAINGQSTHAIPLGQDYTFRYATTDVASCRMAYQGTGPHASQSGAYDLGQSQLNTSGEADSGLIGSYTLTCQGTNGQSASATITITEIPAVPSVSLTINGQQSHAIHNGDSYTIKYATSHVTSCRGTYQGTGPHVNQSGLFDVQPNTSGGGGSGLIGSYTLTCHGTDGQDITRTVTITEIPAQTAVPAVSLTINGQQTYATRLGEEYSIAYSSQGVSSCTLLWQGTGPHAAYYGSQVVPANVSGVGRSGLIGSYTLKCIGANGLSIGRTITISEAGQNTSDVQVSLTANGEPDVTIPENSDFTIKYSSSNAASCKITYQIGSGPQQTSDMPVNTTGTSGGHIVSGAATYTFSCTGTNGSSASKTTKITASPNVQVSLTINGAQSITLPPHTGFTLVYSSANAASCNIRWQVGSGALQTGDIPANQDGQSAGEVGSENITYTMTCGGTNGSTASKTVEIIAGSVLGASTAAPTILDFSAGVPTSASAADAIHGSVQSVQAPTAPTIARFTVTSTGTQSATTPKIANLAGTGAASANAPAKAISAFACLALTRNLSYGSRGADVTRIQKYFIAQGLLAADSATGFYGKLTQAAVQAWQKKNGIASSGTPATTGYGAVGPKTRAALSKCN